MAFPQLDTMLGRVSSERRAVILQAVTAIFLDGATAYSERQLAIFDALMRSLTLDIDPTALIELGQKLAATDGAPVNIIHRLSNDDDIAVAGLVLQRSNVLRDGDLVEVAKTKSQNHLLAIAGRARITVVVTDVLINRGNTAVIRKVTGNAGASLSDVSFCKLVDAANGDKQLAAIMAKRPDLPPELRPFLNQPVGRKTSISRK